MSCYGLVNRTKIIMMYSDVCEPAKECRWLGNLLTSCMNVWFDYAYIRYKVHELQFIILFGYVNIHQIKPEFTKISKTNIFVFLCIWGHSKPFFWAVLWIWGSICFCVIVNFYSLMYRASLLLSWAWHLSCDVRVKMQTLYSVKLLCLRRW
jgi:hypothetical protein